MKIPKDDIIDTIQNPDISHSLNKLTGIRLDLFLKRINSKNLFVITSVREPQLQMDFCSAFYIADKFVDKGRILSMFIQDNT